MGTPILSASEFYAQEAAYRQRLDPSWIDDGWQAQLAEERDTFSPLLGDAAGRSVLDCTCGPGRQAIALAQLGWRVTGSDLSPEYLQIARRRARAAGVSVTLVKCDVRRLGRRFGAQFDWVVSCMALDNLTDDAEIQAALGGMYGALVAGGSCYIRLRDMDNLLALRPRFEFKGERPLPFGRVIQLEDWDYENEPHGVNIMIYLHEDARRPDYPWETTLFAYRRRMLRKADLMHMLQSAGFTALDFLPQRNPWHPYSIVARKPS